MKEGEGIHHKGGVFRKGAKLAKKVRSVLSSQRLLVSFCASFALCERLPHKDPSSTKQ